MTRTALLVIDAQVGLFAQAPHDGEAVLARIAALLGRARAAGAPVVFVQDVDVGGPGSPDYALPAALAPAPGEPALAKTACDAFYDTALEATLRAADVTTLVVCGMKSQFCIDTSVRRATSLGFHVHLVGDAHTTTDSAALPAPAIVAHENATLHGLGTDRGEVTVVASDDVRF